MVDHSVEQSFANLLMCTLIYATPEDILAGQRKVNTVNYRYASEALGAQATSAEGSRAVMVPFCSLSRECDRPAFSYNFQSAVPVGLRSTEILVCCVVTFRVATAVHTVLSVAFGCVWLWHLTADANQQPIASNYGWYASDSRPLIGP